MAGGEETTRRTASSRRGSQPAGVADPQDPRHQGGRGGRRRHVGVVRPDDLQLDRQTPRGLPERAGQPVKIMAHISLADLMILDGSSALQEEWTARVRAEWAAHRAAASVGGSDGGAWLDGDAARAMACDAAMTPIVTGDVNPAVLEDLVRLCVHLDRLRHHGTGSDSAGQDDTGATSAGSSACEVHHLTHKADGGKTSVK